MYSTAKSTRVIGLAVTTALAGTLLAGCTTNGASASAASASRAEAALADGRQEAVRHAEAAVLAEPRSAARRAAVGAAYLDAGRFASAETSFADARQLGDSSPRTVLSLALALSSQGKYREASTLLNQSEGEIATADLGLALALAGQPERGIHLMSNAIRGGENTAKMRQNLAFAYALAGRWREARLMAAQDVPANQLDDRIEQWAQMAGPDAWPTRVASLLNVPAGVSDAGQPVQLALSNSPAVEQASAFAANDSLEEASVAVAAVEAPELPAVAEANPVYVAPTQPSEALREFQSAFASPAPAPVAQDAAIFAPAPAPVRQADAPRPAPVRTAAVSDGTHLVQLGSFSSEAGARRAWGIYARQYPELSGHEMVITEAVVRGKRYWRVSAAGFDRGSSASMCGRVKSSGNGCFAWAEGRPLPGAVDRGVRLAQR